MKLTKFTRLAKVAIFVAIGLVLSDVNVYGQRGRSSSSSRSFSSGSSRSSSSFSGSRFGGSSRSSASSGSGSRFGGGASKTATNTKSFTASSPKANEVGSQAAKARAQQASRSAKATAEAPTPKAVRLPSGKTYTVPKSVSSSPSFASAKSASTRSTRVTNVYNTNHYGGWSYHPYQSDPFHPMLTGFLLGRLSQPTYYGPTRDWVYANYDTMDPIRREELLRENSQLRVDIAQMRANAVPVQQVALNGVDPDLMYNDQVAQTLYVPVNSGPSFWRIMGQILGWVLLISFLVFVVWVVFTVEVLK